MPVLTKINTNVIADDAVTAAKMVGGAVVADIGVGSVTASHIAADAVGSSEIADDAVLPANISHLGDGTGNLSGTITNEQLHFGTAFTLTDDLTVNGDVTLGKVRDDSTGQSITGDGKTLTGTGTLRMGSSMSGRGRLGSGVTFPSGHVLQVVTATYATEYESAVNTYYKTALTANITCSATSSKVLILVTALGSQRVTSAYLHATIIKTEASADTNLSTASGFAKIGSDAGSDHTGTISITHLHSPSSTNQLTFSLATKASNTYRIFRDNTTANIILMEIAG